MKGERRYRVGRWGRQADRNGEDDWSSSGGGQRWPRAVAILIGVVGVFILVAVVWVLVAPGGTGPSGEPGVQGRRDEARSEWDAAETVARAFLREADPERRLVWVRDPEAVRGRLSLYPAAARNEVGEIDKLIGHAEGTSAFAVELASGEIRLLEVVETGTGPRVDWDAYARYGTASWADLWSGGAERAVVRVFCEPSSEAPVPFDDRQGWTAFRLSSPDLPQMALGFAEIGTVREAMMKKVVLGSPRYRQRFVLEVVRHEGEDEPLFEITRCRAVGWVEGERAVEELWAREAD